MKYLGIDFGIKRIGVAISDEAGEFAFPKKIVPTDTAEAEIVSLCKEEGVGELVIGWSVATNEQENTIQQVTAAFAKKLSESTGLPIHFEREDFSSVEAHRFQILPGKRDDSAAAIILQRFLDKKKHVV
jgi:putative holliday junction resolvase